MSRSVIITDHTIRLAAERVIRACGPVLANIPRNMMHPEKNREVDEAKGSLLQLAAALERKP